MTTTKTILARVLLLIYLAAIALICFMSAENIPSIQREMFGFPTDKVVHFGMFLPFPILAYLAWDHRSDKLWSPFVSALVILLLGAGIAYGTELVQKYLPTRSMDLNDFKADMLALCITTLIVFVVDITHLKTRKNR